MSFAKLVSRIPDPLSKKSSNGSLANALFDPAQIFLKPTNNSAASAVLTQEQQDAAATAKAQTDAAVAANNLRAQQKRAYQANALALGGFADDSLGQPGGSAVGAGSVLSQGASAATRAAAASTTNGYAGGTALGAGASSVASGGGGARLVVGKPMQR